MRRRTVNSPEISLSRGVTILGLSLAVMTGCSVDSVDNATVARIPAIQEGAMSGEQSAGALEGMSVDSVYNAPIGISHEEREFAADQLQSFIEHRVTDGRILIDSFGGAINYSHLGLISAEEYEQIINLAAMANGIFSSNELYSFNISDSEGRETGLMGAIRTFDENKSDPSRTTGRLELHEVMLDASSSAYDLDVSSLSHTERQLLISGVLGVARDTQHHYAVSHVHIGAEGYIFPADASLVLFDALGFGADQATLTA